MKFFHLVILTLFVSFMFTKTAGADGLKEGKWSMTMVTKMENMPPEMAAAMQQMQNLPPEVRAQMQKSQAAMGVQMDADGGMTMTHTQCITNQNPIPQHMKMMDGCQQTHEIVGNTVNFHTVCDRDDMQMDVTGSMTYSGDTMQGHIQNHQVHAGRTMDSTIDITGQYVGPC